MGKNPKMMYCRNCNTPMTENEVVCQACGARNKKLNRKKWWLILLVSIILFGFLRSISSCSSKPESTPEVKTEAPVVTEPTEAPVQEEEPVPTTVVEPTKSASQNYAVGETVKISNVQVVINEVKEVPGTEYYKPEPGNRFISADLTVENLGSVDYTVSSMMLFTLKDSTGQEYSISISGIVASGGQSLDGTIVPGDKLRGLLVFEVPVGASGFVLVFVPNLLESATISFDMDF